MEIVRYAPDQDLGNNLVLKCGETYIVTSVFFSKLAGILFQLNGYTVGSSNQHHRFPANHFRAKNGNRADIVIAKPGTAAFKKYGRLLLYISDLQNVQGEEMIRCREYRSRREHKTLLPYAEFTHE